MQKKAQKNVIKQSVWTVAIMVVMLFAAAQQAWAVPTSNIIVEKQTKPDGANQSFEFSSTAGPSLKFFLNDGETVQINLASGTYLVNEINIPDDWSLTSIVCDDDNSSGGDVNTATATIQVEALETVTCVFYNSQLLDYGDAPDPTYPTLLASNGARHVLNTGPFLGAAVDAEADGQPSPTAMGDDLSGAIPDDEDGVVFTTTPLTPDETAGVKVTASASGLLNAWIDFNDDGDWTDTGEQIFTDVLLSAGFNFLSFDVPAGATTGTTFARFRFDQGGGLAPIGLALDGEVEDYLVEIEAPSTGDIIVHKFNDLNGNGIQDAGEEDIAGWTMRIYVNIPDETPIMVAEGVTDEQGNAYFDNLEPGLYMAWESGRECWRAVEYDGTEGEGFYKNLDLAVSDDKVISFGNYNFCEPEFPTCPEGYYLIDTYEDSLRADSAPNSHTYSFHLYCDADLLVDGFAKEGHPENPNCTLSGGSEDQCTQYQDTENFEVDLDGSVFGAYTDNNGAGGIENAWFNAGPWTTAASEGDYDLTFTHSEDGSTGSQSVAYKVTFCAQCVDCEDRDLDGVCDPDDNCPSTANGPASGNCTPDTDNPGENCTNRVDCITSCTSTGDCSMDQEDKDDDGVGDVCDGCPDDPNNDIDGDGVCGDSDNCPDTDNPDQFDTDQDGIGDECDNCPETFNGPTGGSCFNYFTKEVWGICLDHGSCQDGSGEWYKWCDTFQGDQDSNGIGDVCDPTTTLTTTTSIARTTTSITSTTTALTTTPTTTSIVLTTTSITATTTAPSTAPTTTTAATTAPTTAPTTTTAPVCGNDSIEGSEVCDGNDLGGEDCIRQGFEEGELSCQPDCTGFDTRNCDFF